MYRPRDALRAALRPGSLVVTLLLVAAVLISLRGDLATRPIVRLEVDTGGPINDARAASKTLTTYRVRPGDTLVGIAALHDVDAAAIARSNGLTPPRTLRAGRVLRIPDVAPAGTAATPPPATAKTGVADLVASWARDVGLRADLLQAVTWRESSWRQDAVSDRGALGVGQLLPDTAGWVSARLAGGESLDPRNLDDNVQLAARYLRWLIDRYDGDVATAVAAYHQGPVALDHDGWYPVTEKYVTDVFRLRRSF